MSMGIMYAVNISPDGLDDFDENDLLGDAFDSIGADYIANEPAEQAALSCSSFAETLTRAGFPVASNDLPKGCAFRFNSGMPGELRDRLCTYFSHYLDELKELVSNMTLEEFVTLDGVWSLNPLIDDKFSDHVWFDLGNGPAAYTMMGFLRRLEPDRTYYVSSHTVYLH